MLWVLNSDLYGEPGYQRLLQVLDRFRIDHLLVKPVPFTQRLLPFATDTSRSSIDVESMPEVEIDISRPIMVSGSYFLCRIAKERGWKPGAFLSENLRYDIWGRSWRPELLLNPNAKICKIAEADFETEQAFVRPVSDSKDFSGRVFTRPEFLLWRNEVEQLTEYDPVNGHTLVMISKPTEIYQETRLFVVNNKIVTASNYKLANKVLYSEVTDQSVLDFGMMCIREWTPDIAFVLDIARTPEGFKIVEVNCINAAGFYAADMEKYVEAFEKL